MNIVSRVLGPVCGVVVPLVIFWLELNHDVRLGDLGGIVVFSLVGLVVGVVSASWWSLGYPALFSATWTIWAIIVPDEATRRTPLELLLYIVFLFYVIPALLCTVLGTLVGKSRAPYSERSEEAEHL